MSPQGSKFKSTASFSTKNGEVGQKLGHFELVGRPQHNSDGLGRGGSIRTDMKAYYKRNLGLLLGPSVDLARRGR